MDAVVEFFRSLWVVWMMSLFLGIIAWAYWPKRKGKLQDHADIPLREDE